MKEAYLKFVLYRYFYPNDAAREPGILAKLRIMLLTQGIWALVVYHTGSWCVRNRHRVGFLSKIVLSLLTIYQKMVEIVTGTALPFTSRICMGRCIGHFGQIIPSTRTVMREFCKLSLEVTIG
jgi:serine O-acetyltransferase